MDKIFKFMKIILITSAVVFVISLLDKVKTWNDLFLFIIGSTILICFFKEDAFQKKEREKLLERIKVDRVLNCGEFAISNSKPLSAKKELLLNIFTYAFLIGCSLLLLSFIIIPILTS